MSFRASERGRSSISCKAGEAGRKSTGRGECYQLVALRRHLGDANRELILLFKPELVLIITLHE